MSFSVPSSSFLSLVLAISAPTAIYTASKQNEEEKKFIKWVDFSPTYQALSDTLKADIDSHTKEGETPLSMVDILAYLATRYGGDFGRYKKADVDKLIKTVKEQNTTIDDLGKS